jgi:mono/diheme cytochrome c family protein
MRCIETERACRAVGLGLMLSALGCGGKAAEGSEPPPPSYSAPRATPTSPSEASPPVASADRPQPPASVTPSYQPPAPLPEPLPVPDPVALARAVVENVLLANCGQCHSPVLTPAQAQGGINYINDLDKLVETGLIVPLSSATSRVVVTMRSGSMPPPSSGLPPMTDVDISLVASYIDNSGFWPMLVPARIVDAGIDTPIPDAGADGG